MKEIWGPATPMLIAWENHWRAEARAMASRMSVFLHGRQHIVLPYQTPQYVLRRRAMYGGRKGRAAIKRLRALGAKPLQRQGNEP